MRVLLDECLPSRLKQTIPDHEVLTVKEAGWAGKGNGELLALAAEDFDVFVTIDKNLPAQQNLARLSLGIVVLNAVSNRYADLEPLMSELAGVLPDISDGDLVRLGA